MTVFVALAVSLALVDGAVVARGLPAATLASLASAPDGAEEALRVMVDFESSPPAILGRHEVDGAVLRFVPMFPFDPGRSYRAVLRVDGVVHETTFSIPPRDERPRTLVSAVYPTSDTLPENQLKLYVHFSAPMAGGDGLRHVRLEEENGDEVADAFLPLGAEFWGRDRRRYTIFFDPGRVKQGILPNEQLGRPLVAGKRYRLVLDAEWLDADGLPLVEPFVKSFVATAEDVSPIEPSAWTLRLPPAGSREPLVVDFGEPMDRAILDRSFRVVADDGNVVSGEGAVSREETRWSFVPEAEWRAGNYELSASGDLEDLAGNRIGRPFEVDVFERVEPTDSRERYELPFVIER